MSRINWNDTSSINSTASSVTAEENNLMNSPRAVEADLASTEDVTPLRETRIASEIKTQ